MTDSQRIKNIVEELINTNVIRNESELCKKLDYPTGNFSKIKSGERSIPPGLKMKLTKLFKVNDEYLSNDSLPIILEEKIKNSNKSVGTSLNQSGVNPSAVREMELLKKELEFKTREIELLNMLLAEKVKNESRTKLDESSLVEVLERGLQAIQDTIISLFKSEEEYNKAMEYINKPLSKVSVCVSDAAGKIISVNDEFTKQTGYGLTDVIGKKPGSVLQGQNTDQDAVKKIREAMVSRKYYEGEIINYDKSGNEMKCKLTITPIKDKSGKLEKFISLAVFSKINVLKYN